jgi:hypothetical protein
MILVMRKILKSGHILSNKTQSGGGMVDAVGRAKEVSTKVTGSNPVLTTKNYFFGFLNFLVYVCT